MLNAVKIATSRTAAKIGTGGTPADTPDKLIAAAERLFAEHGYTSVSVRAIAAAAGVNWSLVGYYFRGKEGLLSEVYRRHCSSLNAERLKLLGNARRKGLELEAVIEAFVRPALAEIQTAARGNELQPASRHPRGGRFGAAQPAGRRQLRHVEPDVRGRLAPMPA